tara:strand:+ start:3005 stop:3250 length:246 start_codon:yes stop_codon:yes gene_type:complete
MEEKSVWQQVFIFLILFSSLLYTIYFRKCPKCKRRWAMKKTGEIKGNTGFFANEDYEVEYKCKHCGHRRWNTVRRDRDVHE